MDKMEHWLAHLPSEPPQPGLAGRIVRQVRKRRLRHVRLRIGVSALLAAAGVWLSAPLPGTIVQSVDLPASGIPFVIRLVESLWLGMESLVLDAWGGMSGLQTSVANAITPSIVIGLAALALSTILAIEQLLPRDMPDWANTFQGESL